MLLFLLKNGNLLKTIAFPFISLLLIFSLLAPSFLPFLEEDQSTSLVLDVDDTEKNNKKEESEKKSDEMDFFIKNNFVHIIAIFAHRQEYNLSGYLFPSLEYTIEILDPPPRRLV